MWLRLPPRYPNGLGYIERLNVDAKKKGYRSSPFKFDVEFSGQIMTRLRASNTRQRISIATPAMDKTGTGIAGPAGAASPLT